MISEKTTNDLVGYCDKCAKYQEFKRGRDKEQCSICFGKFSTKIGFQLTTQRSFDYKKMKGLKK